MSSCQATWLNCGGGGGGSGGSLDGGIYDELASPSNKGHRSNRSFNDGLSVNNIKSDMAIDQANSWNTSHLAKVCSTGEFTDVYPAVLFKPCRILIDASYCSKGVTSSGVRRVNATLGELARRFFNYFSSIIIYLL